MYICLYYIPYIFMYNNNIFDYIWLWYTLCPKIASMETPEIFRINAPSIMIAYISYSLRIHHVYITLT